VGLGQLLLLVLRRCYPQREIVAVADRAYASLKLLDQCRKLSDPITFITRLRLDGALYEPAPPRRQGQIGRPRLKGERLPNLSMVAQDPRTVWKPTEIVNCYGREDRTVEIASQRAVWYSTACYRKREIRPSPMRSRWWAKSCGHRRSGLFLGSQSATETVKVPRAFVERLTDAVCYAA
jgi:hypothetical protein